MPSWAALLSAFQNGARTLTSLRFALGLYLVATGIIVVLNFSAKILTPSEFVVGLILAVGFLVILLIFHAATKLPQTAIQLAAITMVYVVLLAFVTSLAVLVGYGFFGVPTCIPILERSCRSPPLPPPNTRISVQYMRLFGGSQIKPFLDIWESCAPIVQRKGAKWMMAALDPEQFSMVAEENDCEEFLGGRVTDPVRFFFSKSFPFSSTPLYTLYARDSDQFFSNRELDVAASDGLMLLAETDPKRADCIFAYEHTYASLGGGAMRAPYSVIAAMFPAGYSPQCKRFAANVAYLFLILQNNTTYTITDIVIHYGLKKAPALPIPAFTFKPPRALLHRGTRIIPLTQEDLYGPYQPMRGDIIQPLPVAVRSTSGQRQFHSIKEIVELVDAELSRDLGTEEKRIFLELKPGDGVALALGGYYAISAGGEIDPFARHFFTASATPEGVEYQINGQPYSMDIRPPNGAAALTVKMIPPGFDLPEGWYQQ